MQYLKIILVAVMVITMTALFSQCFHPQSSVNADPRGEQYGGAGTCIRCHQNISGSFAHSNHYKTSSAISTDRLKKLIAPAKDPFYYTDSSYIRIEEKDNALFQSYFANDRTTISEKFDISFGSGEKAQTYGSWKENKLYQLPLTYFTGLSTWANSPGFTARHARFSRIIESRCFECHASYVDKEMVRSGPLAVTENLDRNSIIYGIDCQRCHGPASAHVKFQQDHPSVKTSRYIVPIRSLSRQQQLDVCAVCHSGNDQTRQRSLFSFIPGDTLSHFYFPDFGSGNNEPDVHGKQLQLLEASRCFKETDITCTSCHNSHGPEENSMALFISKCMDCHRNSTHATAIIKENEQKKRDFNLVSLNCIDCHMPLQTSKIIHFNNGTELKNIPYLIRTHKIAIYK